MDYIVHGSYIIYYKRRGVFLLYDDFYTVFIRCVGTYIDAIYGRGIAGIVDTSSCAVDLEPFGLHTHPLSTST